MSTTALPSPLSLRAGARRRGLSIAGQLVPLAAGMVLWALAIPKIDANSFGEAGLVSEAPLAFYLALGLLLAGAVFVMWLPQPSGWVMAAYITGAVLILYGTVPAITDAPQYSWTYKHIGVVRLIEAKGALSPELDIYNRWPGFFSVVAAFSRVTGSDPMSYAGWFESLFVWLDAIVLTAIAFTVTRSQSVAALTTLIWLLTNWVGQAYFSPQALAYLLGLVMVLVIIRQFPVDGRSHRWVTQVVGSVVQRKQSIAMDAPPAWRKWQSVLIVLALDAAIVATHQLTPYILFLQIASLTLLGLRPRWLVLACAGLTVGFLLPNLEYVQSHFGLFSGANPFDNAQVASQTYDRDWFYLYVGALLSLAAFVLAALGGLRLARVGLAHRAVPIAALGLVPFVLLFGNSYGGEGILRVILFSSPWLAILIAWGLSTLRRRHQLPAGIAVTGLLCGLFLFAFVGNSATNVIPRSEVEASKYFYSHAPAGSMMLLIGDNFPFPFDRRYGQVHSSNLLDNSRLSGRAYKRRDLRLIAASILDVSPNGYLVFSTTQNRYAKYYGTTPPGAFEALERWVAVSPKFSLWHSTSDARIYRVQIARCELEGRCASDSSGESRPGGRKP